MKTWNTEKWRHGDMETWSWRHGQGDMDIEGNLMENGSPGDFPLLFTVCSQCKRKFVVCQFVDEETSGNYPFANGLNGLAHLC